MTQAKHTQGPWSVEKWKKFDGEDITQVSAFSEDGNRTMQAVVNSANNEANASLIAAAPELLEALQEMWDAHGNNTSGSLSKLVLDAINKATGATND